MFSCRHSEIILQMTLIVILFVLYLLLRCYRTWTLCSFCSHSPISFFVVDTLEYIDAILMYVLFVFNNVVLWIESCPWPMKHPCLVWCVDCHTTGLQGWYYCWEMIWCIFISWLFVLTCRCCRFIIIFNNFCCCSFAVSICLP
jgi:hypothetical protein